jgi:hypothetical protein
MGVLFSLTFLNCELLLEMRRLFPYKLSNADLVSAFVYIHTDAICEISKKAKAAVKHYHDNKSGLNIVSELDGIKRTLKIILASITSAELAAAFIINDRLFSVKRGSNPQNQNLRDSGTLDMLENMRQAGKNQAKLDSETKGRKIHKARSVNNYQK